MASDISVAIEVLFEAYRQKPSPLGVKAYLLGVQGISIEAVERAVMEAIQTAEFMPTPAKLRELAGFGRVALEDRASIGWLAFTKALRRHGSYKSVDFDDPGINHAVRAILGWDEDFELTSYNEKRFRDAYCAFYRTGAGDGTALLGQHDRHNGSNGFGIKEPERIACGLPVLLPRKNGTMRVIAAAPLPLASEIGRIPE